MRIRFATQSYRSKSLKVSAQRCVNYYAAAQPKDAKSEVAVFASPGIVDFATCGAGPVRGMHEMGGLVYAVAGGALYSVTATGVAAPVGGTIGGSGIVSMDDNGEELCIVNGERGYIYSVAAGFRLISDADFHAARTVTYINGRFAFDQAGTNEWFISDTLNGMSYSDLFASAEWKSDDVVAVLNHLQNLYVCGARTIEPWQFSGSANFPFQRIEGAAIDRGIASPHALTSDDNKLYLLGNDRAAHRTAGGVLTPISTDAIAEAWQDYATISDASIFAYTFDGHRFIVYNFPTVAATWVFDANTGLWHERESWDANNNSMGRWRANCAIGAFNKTLIGDSVSGKIGYLSKSTYTEFGNTIRGELISPPVHGDGERVFMPWFELDLQTGVGLESGQGSDPQAMLAISDDGGETYSDQEPWRTMGAIGARDTRVRWDRLGSFEEQRCLKVTISDPVPRTIIAARCPGLRAAA